MALIPYAMDNFVNGKGHRYPFPGMQVGDHFPVPKTTFRGPARTAAAQYGRRHGWKFKTYTRNDVMYVERVA